MADIIKPSTRYSENPEVFQLMFDRHDLRNIDQDESGSLSLYELTKASQSGSFKGDQQDALIGMKTHLSNRSNHKIDETYEAVPVIHPWNRLDVATKNISEYEFGLVDLNRDNVLSRSELAKSGTTMNIDTAKRAFSNLLGELNGTFDEKADPRGLIGDEGIKSWHGLNPRFARTSSTALREQIWTHKNSVAERNEVHEELFRRNQLHQPMSSDRLFQDLLTCQTALKEGIHVERNGSGVLELKSQKIDNTERSKLHQYVINNLTMFDDEWRDLNGYARDLFDCNDTKKGLEIAQSANDRQLEFSRRRPIGGTEVSLMDIKEQQLRLISEDRAMRPSLDEQQLSNALNRLFDPKTNFSQSQDYRELERSIYGRVKPSFQDPRFDNNRQDFRFDSNRRYQQGGAARNPYSTPQGYE